MSTPGSEGIGTDIVRPAGLTLTAQLFRLVAALALTTLVSRFLGADALGLLTLSLTLVTISGVVACFGVDQGVIYHVARAGATAPDGADATPEMDAASAARTALLVTGLGGVAVGAVLLTTRHAVSVRLFGAPELAPVLAVMAPAVPAITLLAAALGALQGRFRIALRAVLEFVAVPAVTLTLGAGALLAGGAVRGVAAAYLCGWLAAAVVAVGLALRIPGGRRAGGLPVARMLRFSLPFMVGVLTIFLALRIDTLMLGGLGTVRQVGLYAAASRLALPLLVIVDSVNRAFAPAAAFHHRQGDRAGLRAAYAASTGLSLAVTVPAAVLVVLFARPLLSIFGPEFPAAWPALVVLAVGLGVASAFGAATHTLMMTDWRRLDLASNLLLLVVNIVLNALLIPRLGVLGAALATGTSAASVNVLKAWQVHRLLGIHPFQPRNLGVGLAAAAAAAAAWGTTLLLPAAPAARTVAGIAVFVAIYLPLWWSLGTDAETRTAVATLVPGGRS